MLLLNKKLANIEIEYELLTDQNKCKFLAFNCCSILLKSPKVTYISRHFPVFLFHIDFSTYFFKVSIYYKIFVIFLFYL